MRQPLQQKKTKKKKKKKKRTTTTTEATSRGRNLCVFSDWFCIPGLLDVLVRAHCIKGRILVEFWKCLKAAGWVWFWRIRQSEEGEEGGGGRSLWVFVCCYFTRDFYLFISLLVYPWTCENHGCSNWWCAWRCCCCYCCGSWRASDHGFGCFRNGVWEGDRGSGEY